MQAPTWLCPKSEKGNHSRTVAMWETSGERHWLARLHNYWWLMPATSELFSWMPSRNSPWRIYMCNMNALNLRKPVGFVCRDWLLVVLIVASFPGFTYSCFVSTWHCHWSQGCVNVCMCTVFELYIYVAVTLIDGLSLWTQPVRISTNKGVFCQWDGGVLYGAHNVRSVTNNVDHWKLVVQETVQDSAWDVVLGNQPTSQFPYKIVYPRVLPHLCSKDK